MRKGNNLEVCTARHLIETDRLFSLLVKKVLLTALQGRLETRKRAHRRCLQEVLLAWLTLAAWFWRGTILEQIVLFAQDLFNAALFIQFEFLIHIGLHLVMSWGFWGPPLKIWILSWLFVIVVVLALYGYFCQSGPAFQWFAVAGFARDGKMIARSLLESFLSLLSAELDLLLDWLYRIICLNIILGVLCLLLGIFILIANN